MDGLERIRAVADDPYAYAAEMKKRENKPVIGFFCTYTPEEFIYAAGALPFRLFGTKKDIVLADAHLQSYCCSLARGGLEDALNGSLSFLDGAVFPHTCDSIQRLSDIWRLNAGLAFHIDVVLPVILHTQTARAYMIDVLREFKTDLESALNSEISKESLHRAIKVYNRIRNHLKTIAMIRSRSPQTISGADLFAVVKAAMVMDRDEIAGLLPALEETLANRAQPDCAKSGKRIILSGGICSHSHIYTLLAESGAEVVWDDLCTGSRYFEGEIENASDPVEAIADRYLTRMVCPSKHLNITSRGEHLVNLVKAHRASGVVFLFLKFCDPHAFDYPYLKKYLDDAGVPSLLLEVEEQLPSSGQLRTRFETFVDML
jgi:benzoyl-CoA reductase subunit C